MVKIIIPKSHIKVTINSWKYPKSIPYDGPISTDPNKKMKKGEEGKWLDMIEQVMKDNEK